MVIIVFYGVLKLSACRRTMMRTARQRLPSNEPIVVFEQEHTAPRQSSDGPGSGETCSLRQERGSNAYPPGDPARAHGDGRSSHYLKEQEWVTLAN